MSKTRTDHEGSYRVKEDGGNYVYYHGPFWTRSAAKGFCTTQTRWSWNNENTYTIETLAGGWSNVDA